MIPVVDNGCRKCFTPDMFISDAVVVLLVDLRGIAAVKSRRDDPLMCTSTL